MLVLSRKVGETIVSPSHDIVFTVLGVQGDKVRVGVSAPADVILHRGEVLDRIQKAVIRSKPVTDGIGGPSR